VEFAWHDGGASAEPTTADVVAWVDVLVEPAARSLVDVSGAATIIAVDMRGAAAAAAWIESRQRALRRRLHILVVAAGQSTTQRGFGYAVEDHLAAGALIASLVDRGIDAISPEAAVADAAFRSLENAVGPLVAAAVRRQGFDIDPGGLRVDRTLDESAVRVVRTGRV
jgi:2-phosphosulfolactate phosphatase